MSKNLKILLLTSLTILFSNCGGAKYNYHFEKGRSLDFSRGTWILNEPETNYNLKRIAAIAEREFEKILEDSLVEFSDLQKEKMLPPHLAFELSHQELKHLKMATNADYLINISTDLIKNEMGSFATAPGYGSRVKSNEAATKIRIYDLNKQELLSESSVHGIAKKTKTADDGNWDYVSSGGSITMKGLARLIKRYNKNKIEK